LLDIQFAVTFLAYRPHVGCGIRSHSSPVKATEEHVKITDFIRRSATDHEIRFLLTSYLDAVRHGDDLNGLSQSITTLPVTDLADVNRRVASLLVELDNASKRLDDRSCGQIKQALHLFIAASDRWRHLAGEHRLNSQHCL
jgi:hypothetical protein